MSPRNLFGPLFDGVRWNQSTAPMERLPTVPYVKGSDTSEAAAESMREHVTQLAGRVLRAIASGGASGFTCDEVEVLTGMAHQTCSARVNELMRKGRIVDTGQRRKTRSGRKAVVWRQHE
jgi:hypothetical protein